MPNLPVCEYVKQKTGVDPANTQRAKDASALIEAATRLQGDLGSVLYNALVRLDGQTHLSGPPLTAPQLKMLAELADLAKSQPACPASAAQHLEDFSGAARRYTALYHTDVRPNVGLVIINKQEKTAVAEGTHYTPRHTLMRADGEIYENLTWMTKDEIDRIENRFAATNGLFAIQVEQSRDRPWGLQTLQEHKVTLGSGGFGSARLTRNVNTDEYLVFKKSHPNRVGPKPQPLQIMRGVNDGTAPGISRVHTSFTANSTRGGGLDHGEPSAYTITELGVIDAHRFISVFSAMSYALNPEYQNEPVALSIRKSMLEGQGLGQAALIMQRMETSPCKDPETVRQFKNTMALQMLRAVQHMHQRDRAHNDIKPDNFVFAYGNDGLLRVKLIDFDLNASVKESVGRARNVYAEVFAAPQVSSSEVNNRADRNDAYSVGCTIRVLNGEPLELLALRRLLAKGEIRDADNKRMKPVEDRRSIETRFLRLPELTALTDIANLLTHPHSGKRYTITEAIQSPLFTTPGNLMSDREFSQTAEKIIRQSYMLPSELRSNQHLVTICERLATLVSDQSSESLMGPMGEALTRQDTRLLIKRYKATHGAANYQAQLEAVEKQLGRENMAAGVRRGLRMLNVAHHMKSAAEREAGYVYKSPKK
ncbi:MAG TPA: hypothetical protein VFV39_06940 [Limnobacter sp.]|nr:hypothetical protein [Limnobacter sp.]